jgi:poly-gamma-glutamate synthesis protein (capsule biosynthesis protein)
MYPWLYLKDGQPIEDDESIIELIATGDIMLGRGVTDTVDPLGSAAPWLRSADLAIGNLEGVFDLSGGKPVEAGIDPAYADYRLLLPSGAVNDLKQAGFDLLGVANNHALDLGAEGLANTVELLEKAGIQPLGVKYPDHDNASFALKVIDGVRLAFLAVNTVPLPVALTSGAPLEPYAWGDDLLASVRAARQQADIVVVSIHWGFEYQTRQDPGQQEMAQELINAGADLVIGHHPHVVQGAEILATTGNSGQGRASFIAYSLGNFAFDQSEAESHHGLALRVFVDHDGLRGIQGLPIQSGPKPRLIPPGDAEAILERIQPALPTLTFTCTQDDCQLAPSPTHDGKGIFRTGAIDLTGDGKAEIVRLADYQVSVLEDGKIAWQSPTDWKVLDLSLGDPNDDGRWEMLLALEKADDRQVQRSHPFIIGYRGGIFRQVWGGSAVSEPLREVELADIDSDGVQELIVLEDSLIRGRQTIGVWDWNGWGFSLKWRSQPGIYQDLIVNPATNNGEISFSISYSP